MAALIHVDRIALGAAAVRLRSAARCVVAACERQATPVPAMLTEWPALARRSGWARGRESDQAEDERLRELVDVGARTVADLRRRAPQDPLVCLADSSFTRAAGGYLRVSAALHDARRSIAMSDEGARSALHGGASLLVREIEEATALQEAMPTVRLVPAGLVAVGHLLQDDLEALHHSDAPSGAAYLQLARDLDGALAIVLPHRDCLPVSIVSAAEGAAGSLALWDRATGAFRGDAQPLSSELPVSHAVHAYRPDEPEAARLLLAERSLAWRIDEVADRLIARLDEPTSDLTDAINLYMHESSELRDGFLAPAALPARDDVHRDHALAIAGGFERLGANCFDSSDARNHDLGRTLLRARDAAVEYLVASEELAERVRREAGPRASTFDAAIAAAHGAWTAAHASLVGRPVGEVAVAEMAAAGRDIVQAQRQNAARPAETVGVSRVVGSPERRACQSVRWLLAGDAATHLALSADGRRALAQLHTAWHQLEAAVGVRHPVPMLSAPEHQRWLSDLGAPRAHSGVERVGQVIGRLRHGHVAARDVRTDRGRGPSVTW